MSLWNQQRSEKKKKERKGGEGGREHDPLQGEAVRGVVVCGGRCFSVIGEWVGAGKARDGEVIS